MLNKFCSLSQKGEAVWINDVRAAFDADKNARPLTLRLTCLDGSMRGYDCPIPHWSSALERDFVKDYLTARIFNVLSCWSGRELTVYFDTDDIEMSALVEECIAAFGSVPGLKKVLNIAARLCRGTGNASFEMNTGDIAAMPELKSTAIKTAGQLGGRLRAAVDGCAHGAYCGMDVGGTDIKLAVSLDGRLIAVKEYDWNPAASLVAEGITGPIVLLVQLMACCAAGMTPALQAALDKDASDEEMTRAVAQSASVPLDVLGVSFPDVVIRDRIVGGESPKTKGMRENPAIDYETAFAGLGGLVDQLRPLCREGAALHMTNDGHIAAFTAAAELAFSGGAPDFSGGVIAHALGTDFGVGYLDSDGSIPEMPVELYDFLLDLGSFPQRQLPPEDLRSTRNENSGLPGARRYLGQAAAFRLAYDADPALLEGFIEERNGILAIRQTPEDMRKPCLAHLMEQAAAGNAAAQSVFRQIGRNVGQISREMRWLMQPRTDVRYLFGRFVKHPACFRLLQEGCREIVPDLRLEAADEDLMCTPLMRQLPEHGVTVAQFGQAVGAMYYAAI